MSTLLLAKQFSRLATWQRKLLTKLPKPLEPIKTGEAEVTTEAVAVAEAEAGGVDVGVGVATMPPASQIQSMQN